MAVTSSNTVQKSAAGQAPATKDRKSLIRYQQAKNRKLTKAETIETGGGAEKNESNRK
jgi:hypothetical protein